LAILLKFIGFLVLKDLDHVAS